MGTSKIKVYATISLGFCELLFYSGTVYGWAALVYVLKAEGFYSHLCQNENETASVTTPSTTQQLTQAEDNTVPILTCQKQDATLNLVFTIASFALQGSMALFGILHDNLGTRFSRILLQ